MTQALSWIAAILITGCIGALAAQESAPATNEEPVLIPAGVCPLGHVGVWAAPSVMECLKERP